MQVSGVPFTLGVVSLCMITALFANTNGATIKAASVVITPAATSIVTANADKSKTNQQENRDVIKSKNTAVKVNGTSKKRNSSASPAPSAKTMAAVAATTTTTTTGDNTTVKPNAKVTKNAKTVQAKVTAVPLVCPKKGRAEFQLFPRSCESNSDCHNMGKGFVCCKPYGTKICTRGVPKPATEQKHEPLLWLIPRKCPKAPLGELWWDLKTCETDQDCWPRVCCPDGTSRYCRTSQPQFSEAPVPAARQLSYPFDSISQYLQCTPPPAPVFDLYPKACNNTLDCFPNVCCQESGQRFCRPPQRSLLAFLTGITQRFNVGFIKEWTDNLVIR